MEVTVMTPEITVAVLSLVGTLTGTFGGIMTANRLTNYRIDQLEKKVEKHNNLIERTYKLEERTELQEEKLQEVNRRIGKLEEFQEDK